MNTGYRYANEQKPTKTTVKPTGGGAAVKAGLRQTVVHVAAGYVAKEAGYRVGKALGQTEEKAQQTGRRSKALTNAGTGAINMVATVKNMSNLTKAGKASLGVGALTLAADAATAVAVDRKWISKDTAKTCYTASNVVGYAATGAAIGSCFGPGPGTLLGAVAGGVFGAIVSAPMYFSA